MSKIAIFFGPEKGAVNRVADKVAAAIGTENVELVSVNNATYQDIEKYEKIIFGISTVGKESWDSSYQNVDWAKFLPEIGKANYDGKTLAIFGLGDHVTYAGSFVDHIGLLASELEKAGAKLVGQVSTEGYEFDESTAVVGDKFVGLPIDEDFEPELTDERVENWVNQIKADFGF